MSEAFDLFGALGGEAPAERDPALRTHWTCRKARDWDPVSKTFSGLYVIALVTCRAGEAEMLLQGPREPGKSRVLPSVLEYGPELQAEADRHPPGEVWTAEVERMPSWKDKFGPGPWGRSVYEQMMDEGYDPS